LADPVAGKLHLMNPALVVLDTNVVLDWLVFDNVQVGALVASIELGTTTWLSCAEMRSELAHVLAHAHLSGIQIDAERALTSFDRLSRLEALPGGLSLQRIRCSDPSDQMFVDLALATRARWLLTRDRALLKLGRKVAPLGLLIRPPQCWRPGDAGASAG
jgi:predicted nucleic acid-binding protein